MHNNDDIMIAIAKGRIFNEAISLLAKLDIHLLEVPETTRKLILETSRSDIKIVIVRPTDVPTYVEHGAADMGITGKDVLMELDSSGLYDLLDLKIACCRMVLAASMQAKKGCSNSKKKVATKYVNTTRNYFVAQSRQVEIIKLYGSMELAPLFCLADQIVDLIDTGNTLKANGLIEVDHIADISSMLIVNKGAMKMKNDVVKPIIEKFATLVDR